METQTQHQHNSLIVPQKRMLLLQGVILAFCSLCTIPQQSPWSLIKASWRLRHVLYQLYQIRNHTFSLNHKFLLMVKVLYRQPLKLDDNPWDTYADCKQIPEVKDIVPYLLRIDQPMQDLVTISNEDGSEPKEMSINFSSYSYLNMIRDMSIRDFVFREMTAGNYSFGNHGPRMLGGNNYWISKLESALAKFTNREAALCYSSGFLACKTVVQAVANKGDIIFADTKLHESLKDGIRCARSRGCSVFTFQHNDMSNLEFHLHRYRDQGKNAFIIIEGVYSMDGDMPDLGTCQLLAKQYRCQIILDEAHSLGIIGHTGRGLEELQGCAEAAWLVVGSLTKSLGSVGGFVCGPKKIIDFLHFFSTGTMFSAPISVPNAIAAFAALQQIEQHPEWIEETQLNMELLCHKLRTLETKYPVKVQSMHGSPLVAFILRDFLPHQVFQIAKYLRDKHIYVAAVNPPACPIREPRLRLTAPRGISDGDIDFFVQILHDAMEDVMKQPPHPLLNDFEPLLIWSGMR